MVFIFSKDRKDPKFAYDDDPTTSFETNTGDTTNKSTWMTLDLGEVVPINNIVSKAYGPKIGVGKIAS